MLTKSYSSTITLRAITLEDTFELCSIRNDPQVVYYLDASVLNTAQEELNYITNLCNINNCYTCVIESEDKCVGVCYLTNFNSTHNFAFVTFYLKQSHWGKGIMQQALRNFVVKAFSHLPQLYRIEAQVHEHNIGSCKLLSNVGFIKEGEARHNFFVNNTPFNSHIYGLLRTEVATI